MGKLIYPMITSLDGYAEAAEGDLGRGADVAGSSSADDATAAGRRTPPVRSVRA